MAITLIKNTQQEAVVKVTATGTIDLQTTILGAFEVLDGDTQTVNIISVSWAIADSASAVIARNSVDVITLTTGADNLEFDGQTMAPETTGNTSDIVVTIAGSAQVWLKLRKAGGYKSKAGEYASYGSYEDETRVGASTTVNGSPDYVAP